MKSIQIGTTLNLVLVAGCLVGCGGVSDIVDHDTPATPVEWLDPQDAASPADFQAWLPSEPEMGPVVHEVYTMKDHGLLVPQAVEPQPMQPLRQFAAGQYCWHSIRAVSDGFVECHYCCAEDRCESMCIDHTICTDDSEILWQERPFIGPISPERLLGP